MAQTLAAPPSWGRQDPWLCPPVRPQGRRPPSPRCRKSVPQAGGGALWVEGKGAGWAAEASELRNSPKRSGCELGGASASGGSRSRPNGSAAVTPSGRA